MFKRLRIAFLLYVLLFVAVAQYFAGQRSKDWDEPLWVDVYAVAADHDESTRRYLDELDPAEFKDIEPFLAREAERYHLTLAQPFRLRLVGEHRAPLPTLSQDASMLGVLWWSLRMRWLATRLRWQADGPSGDVLVFAARDARATNQVVLAHELLHTLGATDKYAPATNTPMTCLVRY